MNKNIYIGLDVGGANTKVTVFDANLNIVNVISKNIELITPCSYDDHIDKISEVDWVLEAVAEKLEIKHIVYKNLLPHLKDSAIITSNTSGIPLEELISVLPEEVQSRFMITHFFNPPRYMRLLELVRGTNTADEVYNSMAEFGETIL